MPIGPETHLPHLFMQPMSMDSSLPRYFFLARTPYNQIDPSILIETVVTPSAEILRETPHGLFPHNGNCELVLWRYRGDGRGNGRILNYSLNLGSQPFTTHMSLKDSHGGSKPLIELRSKCQVSQHEGLRLGIPDDPVFTLLPSNEFHVPPVLEESGKPLPDGEWHGKGFFRYRLNLSTKPFYFENTTHLFTMTQAKGTTKRRMHVFVVGVEFNSRDFKSMNHRIKALLNYGSFSEAKMRKIVNPYLRFEDGEKFA